MVETTATALLADRLRAAGIPVIAVWRSKESRERVVVATPRGPVAFAIVPVGPALVAGTSVGGAIVPLIGLPGVVLQIEPEATVDIALMGMLSVLAPAESAAYVAVLDELAAVQRAALRRFGVHLGRTRPALVRWPDALAALRGRPLRARRLTRRYLAVVRRRFWRRLADTVRERDVRE